MLPRMPRGLSPAQFLAASFAGLIAIGTLLLALPIAAEPGQTISLLDALFTSTSAVCVTGLIVVDTPRAFSTFGEVVIMLLIAAGGLGYMTLSTALAALFGRRLSLEERATLQESLNIDTGEGLRHFVLFVAKFALAFELSGAAILTLWWLQRYDFGHSAYYGLFHAVSAFNNAGFSLFSDNLMGFRGDVVVNLVISLLIIVGGLGFFTMREVLGLTRSNDRLTLHTKLVLVITGALLAYGTATILVLEWANPKTLGGLPVWEKVLASWFQSVSPRTAGFNTISIGDMTPAALFVVLALMFIGASPGSTGGGIKTTTFGVTVLALWSTVRGTGEPSLFYKRIGADVVGRAFFISLIAFLTLNFVAGIILMVEHSEFLPTVFETTSAFGTVGLSMGKPGSVLSLAGHYSPAGKLLTTLMMFLGRVGPLTVVIALVQRRERARLRYPEGRVFIG